MKCIINAIFVVSIMAILAGCGGGGETTAPALTVAGVAAAGSPLVGTVTLKDSSDISKQLSTSIGVRGSFSFNVSGLTAPFLVQAKGTASGNNYTLYSLATNSGNCNINPLTHLAVTMANGGQDPASVFGEPTATQIATISAALPNTVANIQDKLAPIFSRVEASPVNIITDQMTAYGPGIDLLFEMVSIAVVNGNVSMVNKADGGIILPSTSIAGGVLSGNPNLSIMSPVFTINGHVNVGLHGRVSAWSKVLFPTSTPVTSVLPDAQGNYKLLVPNGAYVVCVAASVEVSKCVDVTVSNANVTGINF